jgi:hypothetical protein
MGHDLLSKNLRRSDKRAWKNIRPMTSRAAYKIVNEIIATLDEKGIHHYKRSEVKRGVNNYLDFEFSIVLERD